MFTLDGVLSLAVFLAGSIDAVALLQGLCGLWLQADFILGDA